LSTSAYPTEGGMGDVLLAMKQLALQTTGKLEGFADFRIAGLYLPPFESTVLYFIPSGSPEEELAEHDDEVVKRANHRVFLDVVKHNWALDEDEFIRALTGTESENGLTDLIGQVVDFYEHNWLGLSGLEPGEPPTCEVPDGAYDQSEIQREGKYVYITRVRAVYSAWTKPFIRTGG
jgi:hypothetical protein